MELRTLSEQAAAVAAGKVSPPDLVEDALAAIERVQAATNAFTHVFADDAITRARDLSTGRDIGQLHGVPIAVKELYDVAGAPTTGCCAAYAGRTATSDSTVVERLRAAGAIIVAKTNQHELAIGGTSLDSSFGPVVNPWDRSRVPGGSSGGSAAAVATGALALAMASDTAGSIRLPSSFCGATGLKTALGAVGRSGTMPLAPSLDTMGPIAADAADCALVYSIIAGFDPADPWSQRAVDEAPEGPLKGKRIGLPAEFFDRIAPETRAGVESAALQMEALGAHVEPMHVPDLESIRLALGGIFVCEFADQYRDLWDDDRPGERVRQLLDLGRAWPGPDLAAAHAAAAAFRHALDAVFEDFDMLLAPSTPHVAQPIDAIDVAVEGGTIPHSDVEFSRLAMPVNLAGLPALAFPAGFTQDGLPVGAQLIGPKRSTLALCAAGREYQEATDWHRRRPPGF